jgi:hypothetical protein
MGTFITTPSATGLISASQDIIYEYTVTIATTTSTYAPAVIFNVSINSIAQSLTVPVNAFYKKETVGANNIFYFRVNMSQYLKDSFDNEQFFTGAILTIPTIAYQKTLSITGTDYLPSATGILSVASTTFPTSTITTLNALKTDLAAYFYTATPIKFLTGAPQNFKIPAAKDFKLSIYGNNTTNSFKISTLDRFKNEIDSGVVLLVSSDSLGETNDVNIISLNTLDIINYTYETGDISSIDDETRFLQIEGGNFNAGTFTVYTAAKLYYLDWSQCNYITLIFQNSLGTLDYAYFEQFNKSAKTKRERYNKSGIGYRNLSGQTITNFDVLIENVSRETYQYLENIFYSGIVKLIQDGTEYEVITANDTNTTTQRFDENYDFTASFEVSEIKNTFNN